ncbi:hypothetical protein F5Y11DRAFT_186468 [Daldinia sp. FL1419]|nr:hypothetical protein F5Y11DRAFT_186468 [Daldinia sp. FL1419]
MSTPSFTTKYTTKHYPHYNDGPALALQQAMHPKAVVSPNIYQHRTFTYHSDVRPASTNEIFVLALGTCFLILLMVSLLLLGTNIGIKSLVTKRGEATRNMDLEHCCVPEERPPKESRSFLSNLRKMPAEEFIKSVCRKSTDLVTSIERDAGELRRMSRPLRGVDEANLGNGESFAGTIRSSFLRRPCRTADVMSV